MAEGKNRDVASILRAMRQIGIEPAEGAEAAAHERMIVKQQQQQEQSLRPKKDDHDSNNIQHQQPQPARVKKQEENNNNNNHERTRWNNKLPIKQNYDDNDRHRPVATDPFSSNFSNHTTTTRTTNGNGNGIVKYEPSSSAPVTSSRNNNNNNNNNQRNPNHNAPPLSVTKTEPKVETVTKRETNTSTTARNKEEDFITIPNFIHAEDVGDILDEDTRQALRLELGRGINFEWIEYEQRVHVTADSSEILKEVVNRIHQQFIDSMEGNDQQQLKQFWKIGQQQEQQQDRTAVKYENNTTGSAQQQQQQPRRGTGQLKQDPDYTTTDSQHPQQRRTETGAIKREHSSISRVSPSHETVVKQQKRTYSHETATAVPLQTTKVEATTKRESTTTPVAAVAAPAIVKLNHNDGNRDEAYQNVDLLPNFANGPQQTLIPGINDINGNVSHYYGGIPVKDETGARRKEESNTFTIPAYVLSIAYKNKSLKENFKGRFKLIKRNNPEVTTMSKDGQISWKIICKKGSKLVKNLFLRINWGDMSILKKCLLFHWELESQLRPEDIDDDKTRVLFQPIDGINDDCSLWKWGCVIQVKGRPSTDMLEKAKASIGSLSMHVRIESHSKIIFVEGRSNDIELKDFEDTCEKLIYAIQEQDLDTQNLFRKTITEFAISKADYHHKENVLLPDWVHDTFLGECKEEMAKDVGAHSGHAIMVTFPKQEDWSGVSIVVHAWTDLNAEKGKQLVYCSAREWVKRMRKLSQNDNLGLQLRLVCECFRNDAVRNGLMKTRYTPLGNILAVVVELNPNGDDIHFLRGILEEMTKEMQHQIEEAQLEYYLVEQSHLTGPFLYYQTRDTRETPIMKTFLEMIDESGVEKKLFDDMSIETDSFID